MHYYRSDGGLFKVSLCSVPFGGEPAYPRKCVEYTYPEGRFLTVSLDISAHESFIFYLDGTLKYHWQGEQGFDEHGTPRWERWSIVIL